MVHVRHELKRRGLLVVGVETLSPFILGNTLDSLDLSDFVIASFNDHVRLFIPDSDGQFAMRDYTVRHFDGVARSLTIEFALHGNGPPARWSSQATPLVTRCLPRSFNLQLGTLPNRWYG